MQGPQGSVDKPFLWADGRVNLKASLNKSAYVHGEHVTVLIDVKNDSRKVVRKIRVSKNFCIASIMNQFFPALFCQNKSCVLHFCRNYAAVHLQFFFISTLCFFNFPAGLQEKTF